MTDLSNYRDSIDSIDKNILELISQRMNISKEIAKFKLKNKINVLDSNRESEIMNARFEILKELGISDKEFVEALFGVILIKSKIVQNEYLDEIKNENS